MECDDGWWDDEAVGAGVKRVSRVEVKIGNQVQMPFVILGADQSH